MLRFFFCTLLISIGLLLTSGVAVGGDATTRFVVSENGATVHDNFSGLTWQRLVAPKGVTWEAALDYCKTLKLGGTQEWQLPTLKALLSLVTEPVAPSKIYIDATAFPHTPSEFFWTMSANATRVAAVFFDMSKFPTGLGPNGNLGHVRCVRGTLSPSYKVPVSASYNVMTIPRSDAH